MERLGIAGLMNPDHTAQLLIIQVGGQIIGRDGGSNGRDGGFFNPAADRISPAGDPEAPDTLSETARTGAHSVFHVSLDVGRGRRPRPARCRLNTNTKFWHGTGKRDECQGIALFDETDVFVRMEFSTPPATQE